MEKLHFSSKYADNVIFFESMEALGILHWNFVKKFEETGNSYYFAELKNVAVNFYLESREKLALFQRKSTLISCSERCWMNDVEKYSDDVQCWSSLIISEIEMISGECLWDLKPRSYFYRIPDISSKGYNRNSMNWINYRKILIARTNWNCAMTRRSAQILRTIFTQLQIDFVT